MFREYRGTAAGNGKKCPPKTGVKRKIETNVSNFIFCMRMPIAGAEGA